MLRTVSLYPEDGIKHKLWMALSSDVNDPSTKACLERDLSCHPDYSWDDVDTYLQLMQTQGLVFVTGDFAKGTKAYVARDADVSFTAPLPPRNVWGKTPDHAALA